MKRPAPQKHWTENSILDYQSRITFDFIAQLERKMESLPMSQADLARALGIGESAVSQVLNTNTGLNLKTIIKYSRKLGLKVAIVAYDDGDPENIGGPVNSEIFASCWERLGKPLDFFDLDKVANISTADSFVVEMRPPKKAYTPTHQTAAKGYTRQGNVYTPNGLWRQQGTGSASVSQESSEDLVPLKKIA